MSQPSSTTADARAGNALWRGTKWSARVAGLALLGLALLGGTLWAAAALFFDVRIAWLRLPLAGAYLTGLLAVWVWLDYVRRVNELYRRPEWYDALTAVVRLDSMSPTNPVLLALSDTPVAPTIKAHSIIPVKGDGDLQRGRGGAYTSAHVDYVESELVVRGGHSCLNQPATIEEVWRLLHQHLNEFDSRPAAAPYSPAGDSMNRGWSRVPPQMLESMP